MFSSRFWLGVIVGIIVMFVLMFVLNVDAESVRAKLSEVFGGGQKTSMLPLEHLRLAAMSLFRAA